MRNEESTAEVDRALMALDEVTGGATVEIRLFNAYRVRGDGQPQDVEVTLMRSLAGGCRVTARDKARELRTFGNGDDAESAVRAVDWTPLDA